jgi:hypothetical protein
LFYFPAALHRQHQQQSTGLQSGSHCLQWDMQQLNLRLNQRPTPASVHNTTAVIRSPQQPHISCNAELTLASGAAARPPVPASAAAVRHQHQFAVKTGVQPSQTSIHQLTMGGFCQLSSLQPLQKLDNPSTSSMDSENQNSPIIDRSAMSHHHALQRHAPLPLTPMNSMAHYQHVINEKRRRCSLPVVLRPIGEGSTLQLHEQQLDEDFESFQRPSSRKISEATTSSSGYGTATSHSRKTSTTSELPVADDDDDDDDDDDEDEDEDSSDTCVRQNGSEHQPATCGEFGGIACANSVGNSQTQETSKYVDCQGQNAQPVNAAPLLQLQQQQPQLQCPHPSRGQTPVAGAESSAAAGAGFELQMVEAMLRQNVDCSSTSKTVDELCREVVVTLDANVVMRKLAYWRQPGGRMFVVRHQYVTLALEVRPTLGRDSSGHGQLAFVQIDGDMHCYRLLRDELVSRILL